jgi:indolepyruvate ferredoxin oxidoreductase alpha subunit
MALARLKVVVSGDIGCYTLGALPPTKAMDTCICMGASISMAHGMEMAAGRSFASRMVAVIGDSTFLHSGMTGLLNTVYNHGTTTTVILDNSITGMTGHQQNPSTGKDLQGNPAPAIDFEALCSALGVKRVRVVDPNDTFEAEKVLKEELAAEEPSVVIARRPCILLPGVRRKGRYRVDPATCTRCRACLRAMCPAMSGGYDDSVVIDPEACTGCGLCARLCKFGSIAKEDAT